MKSSSIDWAKIKNDYIFKKMSIRKLCDKYNVSLSAIRNHSRKENWVQLRKIKQHKIDTNVTQKIVESEINRKVAANEKHNQLFNKGLEVAELLLDQYLLELKQGKKITKANAYNLDFVIKAIANAQKGQRQALNIDKEDTTDMEPEVNIIQGLDIDLI